jgi:replicative DNA helicase
MNDDPGDEGGNPDAWTFRDVLGSFLDRLERRHDTHDHERPVPWGHGDIASMLKGLDRKGLVVLTAPPAFDCESAVLRLVHHVGVVAKTPVLVLSTEWGEIELVERLVVLDSGVRAWKIHCGHLDDPAWAAIGNAIGRLAECLVQISEIGWDEPWEVAHRVRRFAQDSNVGGVVLDAFGSLVGDSGRYQQKEDVAELEAAIRDVASELNVPVILMRPNDKWLNRKDREALDELDLEL